MKEPCEQDRLRKSAAAETATPDSVGSSEPPADTSGTQGRRDFLKHVSVGAATGLAVAGAVGAGMSSGDNAHEAAAALPSIKLGGHAISRLVAGWNPIGGHSHTTLNMARHMREYFTTERTAQFLLDCQSKGITAWQFDHTEKGIDALRLAREKGLSMSVICLHAERVFDDPVETVVKNTNPIAMVHHGGVTDALFRAGKQEKIHDFVKKVHDNGMLAGVSAHNPENIKRVADAGWEIDLFMTCFYYVTRPREEQQEQLGKVTVGEPFFASDPEDMSAVIRAVDQPCLAFKILAAGRVCWTKHSVEKAFEFAFKNIKPTDGVIVGMFPCHYDEVSDNAALTRKYGVV